MDQVPKNQSAPASNQAPLTAPKKSCFNFRNCCLGCLAVFIVLIIIILILISLSGLARIPLLSPLLYGKGPNPSRVVTLQSIDDKYVENLFQTAADKNQNQVVIPEGALSYLINNFANKDNNVLVPEKDRTTGSQISLEPGSAELFFKPRSPRTALTIKIVPTDTRFVAQKFKLGKLPMPVFVLNMLFSQYLDFNTMSQTGGIKSIKLEKGQIVITIDPSFFQGNSEGAPVPFIPAQN